MLTHASCFARSGLPASDDQLTSTLNLRYAHVSLLVRTSPATQHRAHLSLATFTQTWSLLGNHFTPTNNSFSNLCYQLPFVALCVSPWTVGGGVWSNPLLAGVPYTGRPPPCPSATPSSHRDRVVDGLRVLGRGCIRAAVHGQGWHLGDAGQARPHRVRPGVGPGVLCAAQRDGQTAAEGSEVQRGRMVEREGGEDKEEEADLSEDVEPAVERGRRQARTLQAEESNSTITTRDQQGEQRQQSVRATAAASLAVLHSPSPVAVVAPLVDGLNGGEGCEHGALGVGEGVLLRHAAQVPRPKRLVLRGRRDPAADPASVS